MKSGRCKSHLYRYQNNEWKQLNEPTIPFEIDVNSVALALPNDYCKPKKGHMSSIPIGRLRSATFLPLDEARCEEFQHTSLINE